jgi:chorismate mutase
MSDQQQPGQSEDPVVAQYRRQISDADLAIVQAVNRRVALVSRLFAYKREKGYDLFDPQREDWMLTYLTRANTGPLTAERLAELYHYLLDLSKAEAGRLAERGASDAGAARPPSA